MFKQIRRSHNYVENEVPEETNPEIERTIQLQMTFLKAGLLLVSDSCAIRINSTTRAISPEYHGYPCYYSY